MGCSKEPYFDRLFGEGNEVEFASIIRNYIIFTKGMVDFKRKNSFLRCFSKYLRKTSRLRVLLKLSNILIP